MGLTSKSGSPRLVIVMNSTCLPATNGGRIDPWARAQALKALGCRLTLITWEPNGKLPGGTEEQLRSVFEEVFVFGTGGGAAGMVKRLANLWRASPHVSSRLLSQPKYSALLKGLQDANPAAILLDGLYGGALALKLSGDLEIPFFYRSHNIEHRYMAWQAKQSPTLKAKLALTLALTNLKRFENNIQLAAQHVFDISLSDMQYWRSVGIQRNSWLPTLFDESDYLGARSAQRTAEYDIAFVGNLSSPNNQQGVRWLLSEVLPLVRRSRPNVSCLIAGKNPPPTLLADAKSAGVQLIENPASGPSTWAKGRVLINPVGQGSGINVKAIEMLMFDAPLISTSVGLRGLPEAVADQFEKGDNTTDFADRILTAMLNQSVDLARRAESRMIFSTAGIKDALNIMVAEGCQTRTKN